VDFIKVGIFGCGWLGRALAVSLQPHATVYGVVRSLVSLEDLKSRKIEAFQNPNGASKFWSVDALVIAISPRQNYIETINQIVEYTNPQTKQVILISSTSVYKDEQRCVDELSTVDSSKVAVQGELLFKRHFPQGNIIRLGGLMGDDRIAGQWGTSTLKDVSVNYLHQVDAVGIIGEIIRQNIKDEVINVVAPKHPKRSEVYKMNCNRFGWSLPIFTEGEEKVVSSQKSETLLGYDYQFKDPMHFWIDS